MTKSNKLVETIRQTRHNINKKYNELLSEANKYYYDSHKANQLACGHRNKSYCRDPSGGCDSGFVCDDCGLEL